MSEHFCDAIEIGTGKSRKCVRFKRYTLVINSIFFIMFLKIVVGLVISHKKLYFIYNFSNLIYHNLFSFVTEFP